VGGLTVTELVVATGRQKTWIYERLAELQPVGLVERAGQGRYRLAQQLELGWGAVS
jgi:DNA-binding IclR family transcriptional regulator